MIMSAPTDLQAESHGGHRATHVLVATVTHNSSSDLPAFLGSLNDACSRPMTVVVADNDSADAQATATLVAQAGYNTVLLHENRGYGGGISAAVESAQDAPWTSLLIVNPDVTFARDAIDTLIDALESDAGIGAAGPRIRESTGRTYPSARSLPSVRNGIGHALFANIWPGNPWTHRYHDASGDGLPRDAGWLSGACVLVRRAAYEEIGGFDPRFFMYFEDVDLGKRLGEAGWRNRYVPAAEVIHVGARSTTQSASRMLRVHHASAYQYLAKHHPGVRWLPFRLVVRLGLGARAIWQSVRSR